MTLTRQIATAMAEDELFTMTGSLLSIDTISQTSALPEWRGGIEQVRDALLRLASDIEATRRARVQ